MTRREELEEASEDAYFELLMDEVAEMEGAYWEEVRKELENDPAAAMPESVERRCVQTIKRCFARQRRQENLRIAKRVLNRIAVFVAIVSMMITTVLAVSEDARVAAANLLITVNERYTEFRMDPDVTHDKFENVPTDEILDGDYFSKIHIGWLPEGFFYSGGTPDAIAEFENAEEHIIIISCTDGEATLQIDTEEADSVDYIEVNGYQVIQVLKKGRTQLVLINEKESIFVSIYASKGILPDTAIKIAENISFQ